MSLIYYGRLTTQRIHIPLLQQFNFRFMNVDICHIRRNCPPLEESPQLYSQWDHRKSSAMAFKGHPNNNCSLSIPIKLLSFLCHHSFQSTSPEIPSHFSTAVLPRTFHLSFYISSTQYPSSTFFLFLYCILSTKWALSKLATHPAIALHTENCPSTPNKAPVATTASLFLYQRESPA